MIKSIQKIIKVGSSGAVTIPAKEMRRQHLTFGNEVEVVIRPVSPASPEDAEVIQAAKKTLKKYRQDFENLAQR